jgi:hypothetical protein
VKVSDLRETEKRNWSNYGSTVPILIKCLLSDRYKSAVRGFKAKQNNPEQLDL